MRNNKWKMNGPVINIQSWVDDFDFWIKWLYTLTYTYMEKLARKRKRKEVVDSKVCRALACVFRSVCFVDDAFRRKIKEGNRKIEKIPKKFCKFRKNQVWNGHWSKLNTSACVFNAYCAINLILNKNIM